jgi:hypothetical protein
VITLPEHAPEAVSVAVTVTVTACACHKTPQSAIVTSNLGVPSADAASLSVCSRDGIQAAAAAAADKQSTFGTRTPSCWMQQSMPWDCAVLSQHISAQQLDGMPHRLWAVPDSHSDTTTTFSYMKNPNKKCKRTRRETRRQAGLTYPLQNVKPLNDLPKHHVLPCSSDISSSSSSSNNTPRLSVLFVRGSDPSCRFVLHHSRPGRCSCVSKYSSPTRCTSADVSMPCPRPFTKCRLLPHRRTVVLLLLGTGCCCCSCQSWPC